MSALSIRTSNQERKKQNQNTSYFLGYNVIQLFFVLQECMSSVTFEWRVKKGTQASERT